MAYTRELYDKQAPGYFTPMPTDAQHYIYHPSITAANLYLYALIIDKYNADYGYAFPALVTLEMEYGHHRDTVAAHLDDLKAVGLVDFPPGKRYYVPLKPLGQAEFFAQFPAADEAYKKALGKRDGQRKSGKERMAKWLGVN